MVQNLVKVLHLLCEHKHTHTHTNHGHDGPEKNSHTCIFHGQKITALEMIGKLI